MATLTLPTASALQLSSYPMLQNFEQSTGTLTANLLLGNRAQGPQAATLLASYKVNLLLHGNSFALKDYVLSELVSPRPYSYLKFTDGLGNDLSDEMYLGRGTSELRVSASLLFQALSLANLAASIFPVHHRVLPLTGLNATFLFRNYPKGSATAEDQHDVTLFPRAAHALLPEQPDSTSPGNRFLSLQLKHESRVISEPVVIGRCL